MKKIDFHVHHSDPISIEQSVAYFKDMCERKGYEGVCTLSYVRDGASECHPTCNEEALAIKAAMPGTIRKTTRK